jgi:Lrp/AsnC family transcriptional regulator, leucine-responsive regulatory protein
MMLDPPDLQILALLQTDARMANAEIARRVGMAPSAVFERVKKLEASGVIKGYDTRLDAELLGLSLLAFVFVRAKQRARDHSVAQALEKLPEVLEVHTIAGEDCWLVKVRTKGPRELAAFLREQLGAISGIANTRTTVVLETHKEGVRLPLPVERKRST